MTGRSAEIRVGITVFLAIVILVVGVAWIGQYRLTRAGQYLDVDFEDVGGLDVGDPVTIAGMTRGKVEQIELLPDRVRVRLWLESGAALDEDAEIAIESIGMMGEKYVAIRRGGSPRPMDLGEVQRGVYRPGLMEMMAELGDVVRVVRQEVEGLGGALAAPSGTSFADLMAKLDRTLDGLAAVVAENRGDVRDAVQDFRAASEETRGLVGEMREGARGTLGDVGRAAERFESTTEEIRRLVVSLQAVVDRVEEGEGSLGAVINDRKVHDELVRTLRDLDDLIQDIRENPKRYFGLSVF